MPTSSSRYFRQAAEVAGRHGLDVAALLTSVGLDRAQINEPMWRGDIALLAKMVGTTIELLEDEFMGCIADRSRPGTFAMMTNLVVHEPTLAAVIRKGVLFYSLITDALPMTFSESSGGGCWSLMQARPDLDPGHYFHDFWVMTWYRLWTWLIGEPPELTFLGLGYQPAPEDIAEFGYVFPCVPVTGQSVTSLVVSTRSLARPVIRSRSDLKSFLATTPLGVMKSPGSERSTARLVRALLQPPAAGPVSFPPLSQVAGGLHLTEQTLRRRLRHEGTSFRALKEEVRRDRAISYLVVTGMPVQEISRLVGYSEPRAFTRAFQGWTGVSPTAFRRRHCGAATQGSVSMVDDVSD